MFIQAHCIGTPPKVAVALSEPAFGLSVFDKTLGTLKNKVSAVDNPGRHYILAAAQGPSLQEGCIGVNLRVFDLPERQPASWYHSIQRPIFELVKQAIMPHLQKGTKCHVVVTFDLHDLLIESHPGSGEYTHTPQHAEWVYCGP